MEDLQSTYLKACNELVVRQQELAVPLARALGITPDRLFYTWITHQCEQIGVIPGTDWRHFFHGFECDLRNQIDGRYVRYEFGPAGRVDTFSSYSVLQIVMTSRSPWSEFPVLREHLAERPPPYDHFSGSNEKSQALLDRLEKAGYVEPADSKLCSLLKERPQFNPTAVARSLIQKEPLGKYKWT